MYPAQGAHQRVVGHAFDNVAARSGFQRLMNILVALVGGKDDELGLGMTCDDGADEIDATHARQAQIDEGDVRQMFFVERQSLFGGACLRDGRHVPGGLDDGGNADAHDGVIVDHQHANPGPFSHAASRSHGIPGRHVAAHSPLSLHPLPAHREPLRSRSQRTLHYTDSSTAVARSIVTVCDPSRGCFAVSRTVPACSRARTHTAPVPPINAKGLSPINSAGPSRVSMIGSLAKGRTALNSSVTRSTTRVASAPSAFRARSSGSNRNSLSTPRPESDFEITSLPARYPSMRRSPHPAR